MKFLISCFIQVVIFIVIVTDIGYAEKKLIVSDAQKEITISGYTRCSKSVTLSSEISGKAVKVNYKIGDVTGSQPFVKIDPTFISYQIQNKKIQIQQNKARLKKINSRLKLLQKKQKKITALRKGKYVTETKFDDATQKYKDSRLEQKIIKFENEIMAVELRKLESERSRYNINCFKGGIVTACFVETGEYIQAGMPVAEISDFNTLLVQFSISEEEFKAFKLLPKTFDGQVDDIPVKASINYINPKFNEKTRKLDIELKLSGNGFPKRGGLKFSTKIFIDTDGLLIPRTAIMNRYGNPKVKTKDKDKYVSVMILGESGKNLIIAENNVLKPGTELVKIADRHGEN